MSAKIVMRSVTEIAMTMDPRGLDFVSRRLSIAEFGGSSMFRQGFGRL
jgi:hypothetical protein